MILSVPTSTVSDIATAVSGTFDNLGVLLALLISIPLAFYVIRRVMALFPKPTSRPH